MTKDISRRAFIKGAAAVGLAVSVGGCLEWKGDNIPKAVQRGEMTYDILILGSGGAGMRAALEAAKNKDLKVGVMTKLVPTRSASTMAQGGMNGVTGLPSNKGDSYGAHTFDTVKGGDYLSDQDAVEYYAERAGKNIFEMDYMGYPYNRQEDGTVHQRKMGGSSFARAAYYEDRSGHAVVHALFEQCLAEHIDFISECQMLEIVMDGDTLCGVAALDLRSGNFIQVAAKTVIIATGGYGRAYWIRTTNPYSSTGDGIAAGMSIGVPFKDPEMVQFHPTGLAVNGVLLSESSRSEGAYLLNKNGERFMKRYAPQFMELATRDIVSRAIATEVEEGRGIGEGLQAGVYLDFRHIPKERIMERLGQVYDLSLRFADTDITKDPVLIGPTCHYSMGGLEVADFQTAATRIPGVFAAGECSCVSIHGANRLGANSLSEVMVFGQAAGKGAAEYVAAHSYEGNAAALQQAVARWSAHFEEAVQRTDGPSVTELRDHMADTMWFKVGVYRQKNQLLEAAREITALNEDYKKCYIGDASHVYNTAFMNYIELGNLLQVCQGIIMGALARQESRGSHSRRDYPQRDDKNFLKHTLVFKEAENKYHVEYKDVVVTQYPPKERKY